MFKVAKQLKDVEWDEMYNCADNEASVKSVTGTKKYHLSTRYFPEHMVVAFVFFVVWILLMWSVSALAYTPDDWSGTACAAPPRRRARPRAPRRDRAQTCSSSSSAACRCSSPRGSA